MMGNHKPHYQRICLVFYFLKSMVKLHSWVRPFLFVAVALEIVGADSLVGFVQIYGG